MENITRQLPKNPTHLATVTYNGSQAHLCLSLEKMEDALPNKLKVLLSNISNGTKIEGKYIVYRFDDIAAYASFEYMWAQSTDEPILYM